ncbi:hypothetical protein D3C80_1889260 [compost metagenome]
MLTAGGRTATRNLRFLTSTAPITSPNVSLQGERLSTILVKEKRAGGTKATMEPRNGGASAGLCRTVLGGIWADSAAADSAPKL